MSSGWMATPSASSWENGPQMLVVTRPQVPKLLSMVSFADGHRYADFNENTDPVAAYGLAALVAGGVAAKAGLFKGLIALLSRVLLQPQTKIAFAFAGL